PRQIVVRRLELVRGVIFLAVGLRAVTGHGYNLQRNSPLMHSSRISRRWQGESRLPPAPTAPAGRVLPSLILAPAAQFRSLASSVQLTRFPRPSFSPGRPASAR